MNANDLLDIFEEARPAYVMAAQACRESRDIPKGRPRSKLKVLLLVALIALMLAGCAVVYILRLEDMTIDMEDYTATSPTGSSQETRRILSLQGVVGSSNYEANKEWYAYRQSYERDYAAPQLTQEEEMKYYAYGPWDRIMADKIDEICEKYSLELHGQPFHFDDGTRIFDLLGIDSIFKVQPEELDCGGYFYQEGSFKLEGTAKLSEEDFAWPHTMLFGYRCTMKNVFDEVYGVLAEKDYQQWTYETTSGTDVLLVLTSQRAELFVDRQDAFLSIFVERDDPYGDPIDMTPAQAEQLAELFDLTLNPRPLSEEDVDNAREQEKIDREKWREEHPSLWSQPDYPGYAQTFLLNEDINKQMGNIRGEPYYTLLDVNGDGQEEMLIYIDQWLKKIVSMKDGITIEFFRADFREGCLCEGNFFIDRSIGIDYGWEYFSVTRYDQSDRPTAIRYMVKKSDGIWYDCPTLNPISDEAYDTPMTEAEYQAVLDAYTIIDPDTLDLKPLRDLAALAE